MRVTESPRTCSYLPEQIAALEYRLFSSLTPIQVEHLLERGWRRFGTHLFRPACEHCSSCVPIRVEVNKFSPSKSQRKTLRRNDQIEVSVHQPAVTAAHIDLYNRWHEDMTERRGWTPQTTDPQNYAAGFLQGNFASLHEIRYIEDGQLVGLGLVDILPNSISSAYFYHDPDWRPRAPGTFSLLCEIDFAQQLEREFLYLGYWIEDCPSMAYKNRFSPSSTLDGWPSDSSDAEWVPHNH